MSLFEQVIKEMMGLYNDLTLAPSGKNAIKVLTPQKNLVLYEDRTPEEWDVVDTKAGKTTTVKDESGSTKLLINEFSSTFVGFMKDAKAKNEPLSDAEIQAEHNREENERKLAEMEKFEQERQQADEKPRMPEHPKPNTFKSPDHPHAIYSQPDEVLETAPTPVKGEVRLLDILSDLVDDDLIQLFGKTGTCKSSIAIQAALEARRSGKSVYYLDPEKNISKKKKTEMLQAGVTYTPYTPSNLNGNFESVRDLEALHEFIKKIPKVDLLIIDSLGLPCLTVYCAGNQREQGLTLQKMMLISSTLKSYANRNHSMVIVINQPESDMNKDPNTERRSFGDKVEFFYKELLKTVFVSKSPNKTSVVVKTYRSRDYGQGYKLFTVEITDKGVKVIQ